MNRDLVIGIVCALLLHSGIVWWGSQQVRPRPATIVKQETVRTVREQIALPRAPAPPKPEPRPEPEPAPSPATQAAMPPARAPVARPRNAKPASTAKRAESQPNNEPQPLVLSQTYGAAGDSGVGVQTGKDDVLGDPGVQANERNTRPRAQEAAPTKDLGEGAGDQGEAKTEIRRAAPRSRCNVAWPQGAEIGNRIVEVTLLLQIDIDGTVGQTRILRSAGQPFDGAAAAAMKACAFRAGTRDGKPFVDRVPFVVEFKPNPR